MKRMLFPILMLFLLVGCEKDSISPLAPEADQALAFRGEKVAVCHQTGSESNPYEIIEVAEQAWINAHMEHGDAVDMDGDGYFYPENGCSDIDCDGDTEYNPDNSCGPEIGDEYAGGIVFYIAETPTDLNGDGSLDLGLVAAKSDIYAPWGCYGSVTGASSSAVGSGKQNTDKILTECSEEGIAARVARGYGDTEFGGGYDDWSLPSKDELNLMWENLADSDGNGFNFGINDPGNLGGFASDVYWSSTEHDAGYAWAQSFYDGYQGRSGKYGYDRVRAVRAF